MPSSDFPAGFLWGAATSAYQIEGSPLAGGAGPSIWHRFAHTPGKVHHNDHGDIACDHYRRFADDVGLMRELGIRGYRFSIAWSRIFPKGTGQPNGPGIDFYSRLVDCLLEHGIQPFATLYHWDLPAALEDRGGWANPDSVQRFADYTCTMVRALGDRVSMWMTINEPWVIVDQGYVHGTLAPGRCDWTEAAAVSRNLILAHGAAVAAVRSEGNNRVGIAVNLTPVHPATESEADRLAAQRMDAYVNRQFLDPLFRGEFPEEVTGLYGPQWPIREPAELARVRAPIDFVGVNYYLRLVVRDDSSAGPLGASAVLPPNCRTTAMGWEIYPDGLREILTWVRNRYENPPVYITENGAAFDEAPRPNGTVDDPERVEYLLEHLRAVRQAVADGTDLRGYFVWSLLDNFEWQHGFSKRFGIVHVDFETQQRLPKTSARFYSRVIRSNGAALED